LKIIILGAGQVGATLAENLASEANDITVVDTDRFGCVHYKIGSIFEPFMGTRLTQIFSNKPAVLTRIC
jgi:2-polyprenyl-6-methoxyphenol hydroxylase-like FAD-dependent oxidoreductase